MKKKPFISRSIFITLIYFGAQIRAAHIWYTVLNFGLNQSLFFYKLFWVQEFWVHTPVEQYKYSPDYSALDHLASVYF